MRINSKDFGVLDIAKEDIIHFPDGIFAFEEETEFVLIQKDGFKQKWLQSVRNISPRFIVFDPTDIVEGYNPKLPVEVLKMFDSASGAMPAVYVIAVVPENVKDMTVNLKSPVIINQQKRLGMQIILDQANYPIRHRVFNEERREPANVSVK